MKQIVYIALFTIFSINVFQGQVSNSVTINDTRATNDSPNFFQHGIRADFKQRISVGAPGEGFYSTVVTVAQWDDSNNSGDKNHQLNFNNGGLFYRNAYPLDSQWGSWRKLIIEDEHGNVGIGTTNPTSKLTVAGTIASREVKVTVDAGADFVFENDYILPSLDSVANFIKVNKHLPEIASAKEMKENGMNLSEMNIKLLQKIEELTLYVIQQQKKVDEHNLVMELQKKNMKTLDNTVLDQQKRIESLAERLSILERK